VSREPAFPVFYFERQKVQYPASSFLPDIKLSWRKSPHYQQGRVGLGSDKTIFSSSDYFVVFEFSFYVLTQDISQKFSTPCDVHFEKQTSVDN